MVFLKHNLNENMMYANGMNDAGMRSEIIFSELGKLIAVKPALVSEYLKVSGIKVPANPSSSTLVRLVSEGIVNNKKFTVLISEEILGNGRAPLNLGSDGATSGTSSGWSNVDWGALTQQTISVVNSLKDTFGKDKPKQQQSQTQLNQYTNTIKPLAHGGMSSETKLWIGLGVTALLLLGGVIAYKRFAS